MNTLLLEIGTEEIPAGYIVPALEGLAASLTRRMTDARISHGAVQTYGTPRRLAVTINDVADRQTSLTTELVGPPERVGFDEQGKPTVAAVKFAEKAGVPVSGISVKETPKGRYVCAQITEKGGPAKKILQSILPEVVLALPFPKRMKWSDLTIEFARPVQSIAALLGKQVVTFQVGNIKSGRYVFGHRFMAPGRIKLDTPAAYVSALENAMVIPDIERRRVLTTESVGKTAAVTGGRVLPDPELTDIVTNLVEYPVPVAGTFDRKFLELPAEILITAMREHQKYFAVADSSGQLMPHFIAVNNTRAKDMALVTKGHERVLRARLEDARFFFKSDTEQNLESNVEQLKGVLFQAKLGTMHAKIERVERLAGFLAEQAGVPETDTADVVRAARLCKADLVTQVVVEFPKLQGVMGRIYAARDGESEAVAAAIEEHYRPTYSGGPLPETQVGAFLALADKIDSICGCFSIGLLPTGASDPYALRRQAIGIIQIMRDRDLGISLDALIQESVAQFASHIDGARQVVVDQVRAFVRDRVAHMLVEEQFPKDVVAAVTGVGVDHVPNVWKRVQALAALKNAPDFEPLATAFKRVVNIIKKSEGFEIAAIDPGRFEDVSETELHNACRTTSEKVAAALAQGQFDTAMREIASLRPQVDAFFEAVLVMAEDKTIRNNRFALLASIAELFETIADFSKITTG